MGGITVTRATAGQEAAPRILIDTEAIEANVRAVRAATSVPVVAVVKANGYGHGAVTAARAALAGGAEAIGVVDGDEARELRDAGVTARIIAWLHGARTDWDALLALDVEPGVATVAQVRQVALASARRAGEGHEPAPIHIKVDTGLGRGGAHERDWPELFAAAADCQHPSRADRGTGLLGDVHIMSHLSGASARDDARQLERFIAAVRAAEVSGCRVASTHLAASGGACLAPEMRLTATRVGIAVYGLNPVGAGPLPGIDLRPALSLDAPLLLGRASGAVREACLVRTVDGRSWGTATGGAATTPAGATARVPLGLVDGLPPVEPDVVRVTDATGAEWRVTEVGEAFTEVVRSENTSAPGPTERADHRVALIDPHGSSNSVDAWAAAAATINYEFPTRLSARLARVVEGRTPAPTSGGDGWTAPAPASSRPATPAGALAPRRMLRVDVARFAERLARRIHTTGAADEVFVDVTADAYGHGLELLAPVLRDLGVRTVVRRAADAEWAARWLSEVSVDDAVPAVSRAVYLECPLGADARGAIATLETELIGVKRVDAGQGVSYGLDWVAAKPTTLGLVPLGYADALPRRAAGTATLGVGGEKVPIVGRIAMDQVVVDLGDGALAEAATVGDPVVAFTDANPSTVGAVSLTDWAAWGGLTPLAAVASLGRRVRRKDASDA